MASHRATISAENLSSQCQSVPQCPYREGWTVSPGVTNLASADGYVSIVLCVWGQDHSTTRSVDRLVAMDSDYISAYPMAALCIYMAHAEALQTNSLVVCSLPETYWFEGL